MSRRALLLLAACAPSAVASDADAVTVVVPGAGAAPSMRVAAAIGSESSFRLTVDFFDSAQPDSVAPLASPSLDPDRKMASFTRVSSAEGDGIKASFGSLLISDDGRFTLKDSAGKTVASATAPPTLAKEASLRKAGPSMDGITMAVSGSKTGPGANGRRPCLVNGGWGAPFTWDPVDKFFAFAVSPWGYDPDYIHCYPVSFDGLAPLKPAPEDSCTTITHVKAYNNLSTQLAFIHVGGMGGDSNNTCCAECNALEGCTAWQYGSSSKDKTAPNCRLFSCVDQWIPPDVLGGSDNAYLSGGRESQCSAASIDDKSAGYIHQDGWFGLGTRMDWYLAPTSKGGFDYTKALFDLTGAPAVPPLFGMGFMATYWGYSSMHEVEDYMHTFRNNKLPIDSFIMDYDWFGPNPCGAAINTSSPADPDGLQGDYNCGDSGYRDGWWNNVTFKQADGSEVTCATAKDVFDHFHSEPLNMHFGGIRKPRTYSNKNMSGTKGWLLPLASDVGEGGGINFNFSVPEMRKWYTDTHAHFIEDGMDFWWNDEGETAWFTYLLWNQAQAMQWTANKPNTRHFTINRAWQPGMQRFPAISWTGDGQSCTHEELLRGMMNGCPLTSCDLTSPDATTLVRQYQSAVFTPIMRVHMMQGTPRFPWFWPDTHAPDYKEHQLAFQSALEMRYRFLPFLYSLAHGAYRTGKPISHPASFAFPGECTLSTSAQCEKAEKTYMVGSVLIPSNLGLAHTTSRPPSKENSSTAVLPVPSSTWYRWNTTTSLKGGQTVSETLELSEMAVFVAAGAILPLQANSIQYSAQAGGLLEVQVYPGKDGSFVMVEDDGISYDYQTKAEGSTRTTTWSWSDATKTLTWSVKGGASLKSPNLYADVVAVLFAAGGKVQRAASQALTASGGKAVFH